MALIYSKIRGDGLDKSMNVKMRGTVCIALATIAATDTATALSNDFFVSNRRQAVMAASAAIFAPRLPALAFANKISNKYDDRPRQRGSQPPGLGVNERQSLEGTSYNGLKPCSAAPNCFCSVPETLVEDDPDHSIPPFVWPKDLDHVSAMQELLEVIQAYQPGQQGVDGGGFEIKTIRPDYIYVQFESLKNGYVDDVEFAVITDKDSSLYGERQIQVRSSSRLGYLDFGVNAKRLNGIAKALRDKSWNAAGVDYKTHEFYASENRLV
jgi:uncharacterized protein (DUF1499 family)